jgi:hypothetical protein
MEEFDALVLTICSSTSSTETRSLAERRLQDIISNKSSWKIYAPYLFQANDTVCFFICIGLQRIVWRYWAEFSLEDKMLFNQTISQALISRKNMQRFALSKLEQVLATICACSCSLEPALSLMVEASHPNVHTGLSAIRTVLELVLSEDPKLVVAQKAVLLPAVTSILVPLTNLACSVCTVALQQTYTEESRTAIITSLDLLKIVMSKLPIGEHITSDVIQLLFAMAELAAADSESVFAQCSVSSIEVLTEIMSKRFLPPSRPQQVIPAHHASQVSPHPIGLAYPTTGSGTDMLLDLVGKSISLLKKFRY